MLFMQPVEEFLETGVGQNGFYRIERVPKLVMTPGFVDEILTGMARRHDFGSAFAARHHMMSSRRDLPFTKHARLDHKSSDSIRSIANRGGIENDGRGENRTQSEMVRASGNAPDPGTHLVRLRL